MEDFFRCPIEEIDLPLKINGEQSAVEALDDISVEGFELFIIDLFLDKFTLLLLQFFRNEAAQKSYDEVGGQVGDQRVEDLTRFRGHDLAGGPNPPVELKEEDEAEKEGGERGRIESPSFVKEKAAADDRKDIGNGKKTSMAPRKVNEAGDEEMVHQDLDRDESTEMLHPIEKKGIDDGDEIDEADEVIKLIVRRNEERLPFRKLEEIGDGQEEGEDDHS